MHVIHFYKKCYFLRLLMLLSAIVNFGEACKGGSGSNDKVPHQATTLWRNHPNNTLDIDLLSIDAIGEMVQMNPTMEIKSSFTPSSMAADKGPLILLLIEPKM